MLSKAAAISTAVEAEERLRQVQASLRECEEQSNDAVKVLQQSPLIVHLATCLLTV